MGASGGPRIVKDDLKVYLYAVDQASYVGSGTTWKDLSGNGYDATLSAAGIGTVSSSLNTMAFKSGDVDFAEVADLGDGFIGMAQYSTVCIWFKTGVDSQGLWDLSCGNGTGYYDYFGPELNSSGHMTGWALCWNGSYPATRVDWSPGTISTDYRDNTWHQLVHRWDDGTCDTFVDAVKESTTTNFAWKFDGDAMNASVCVCLVGKKYHYWHHGGGNGDHPFNGMLDGFQLYHKALTDNEILQNYNEMKFQFK